MQANTSVFSLTMGQSNPPFFRNFQSSWLSWCTFEGPFRYQLKHVKEKSPGSAESKDANSNGLSIKPSFFTVDLFNKIMNHVTPNDFIELPFRVDLKLKGRPLPPVTLKTFYCIVLLILHSPLGLFLRNWNTWLLTEITNSNTLFS